jgi:hypothetical protein
MPVRLFSIAIILFWLGSVAWLCAVVWAPPGSRMAKIDPREVYAVFFAWNDSTKMTLLENGVRRGEVTIAGGSGAGAETGEFERFLSLSGQLDSFDERSGAPVVDLFWRGTLTFTETMESRGGEFSVRIPSKELSVQLAYDGPIPTGTAPVAATASSPPAFPASMRARVVIGGREVLAVGPDSPFDPAMASPLLGPLASMGGVNLLDPAKLDFTTGARMGNFNLGGREMRAFLLTLRSDEQDQEVRVYLSEAGEPLRIESDLGFEAVSEILVPLEAYQRRPRTN